MFQKLFITLNVIQERLNVFVAKTKHYELICVRACLTASIRLFLHHRSDHRSSKGGLGGENPVDEISAEGRDERASGTYPCYICACTHFANQTPPILVPRATRSFKMSRHNIDNLPADQMDWRLWGRGWTPPLSNLPWRGERLLFHSDKDLNEVMPLRLTVNLHCFKKLKINFHYFETRLRTPIRITAELIRKKNTCQ